MFRRAGLAIIGLWGATALWGGGAELRQAQELYKQTKYREALQILAKEPGGVQPALLAGQCHYYLGDFKKAAEVFETAAKLQGGSSIVHHWLGRAYGRRAENANPFLAPGLASKARQQFEEAVALDPRNGEAINDLFDYYLEAPGFLGGGLDKAQGLLPKIKAIDPAEESYALAKLAERRKDFGTAEQQLKRAMELAPKSMGRVLDVAKFLARRGRVQESDAYVARAEKLGASDPLLLFGKAEMYIEAKRNLGQARRLLEQYMQGPLTPELPSRAEAEKLLRQAKGGE